MGTVLLLALAACSAGVAESVRKEALVPQLAITPGNGLHNVRPGAGIMVQATNGTLGDVRVQTSGDPVAGRLSDHAAVWHSRLPLNTGRQFTVVATARGSDGKIVTATSSFSTLRPKKTFAAMTIEGYQQRYGVGMPIILNFSHAITHKAAIERAIQLRTSRRVVGAWYWDGDKTLYFRPRTYWPPYTRVSFDARFNGVEGAPGVYGTHDLTQSFEIGPSLIVVASTRTHYLHVYYKRRLYGTWPISTGRPGDDTPNGTYVTIDKGNPVDMVGPGYNLEVPWSVRFTWSGDYIHDAYWSVGEQGVTNVSHGCVNTSPAHAQEYYRLAVPGDPVTVTGSPKAGTWGDGWTVWFLSWKELLGGSALHQAVVAGPGGSALVSPAAVPAAHAAAPLSEPRPHNARSS
ncbi:MAG TPA: Ig-like domain-containing protein [Streptosporangiaceae bacterium]|nr:Ig-like domain-containing protein [Streptosporangiaceae bacterium]